MMPIHRRSNAIIALACAFCIQLAWSVPVLADARSEIKLGNQAAQRGAWETATTHFSNAIAAAGISQKNLAVAYNNRGSAWDEQKQTDKALADYAKALELEPRYHEVYYNRSYTYERVGNLKLALADARKALKLSPGDAHYRDRVKYLEFHQGTR